MEAPTKANQFVLQCSESSEQVPSPLDTLLLAGRRTATQWNYGEVVTLQQAHCTPFCAHSLFVIYRCYLTINESMELQAYYAQSGLDYSTYYDKIYEGFFF